MTKIAVKPILFEQMPVRKALLKQIVPAVISQMIVLIYSLADTYFVGLLNDPRQTAAVTVVSSAFLMLTAVSNLFAVGGASLAARTLGRREDEKAKDICALSFWGALLASVLFSLLFWSLASPILYLCGATADTYPVRVRIREVGRALRRRGDRAERPAGKPYSRRGKRAGRRFGRFSGRNLQHCIGPDFRPAPLPESGRGRRQARRRRFPIQPPRCSSSCLPRQNGGQLSSAFRRRG